MSSHTEEQYLQSAKCRLKTQAVCKTFQPNEDTFNANVAICQRKYPEKYSKLLNNFNTPFYEKDFSRLTFHFSLKSMNRKAAFTLAEVLITLGIIGVVAALTLPPLINNYRAKVLETNFKKADAILSTAMRTTMFENGLTRFYDFERYCKGNYCTDTKASDYDELQDTWREQFDIVNDVDLQYIRSRKYKAFGFFGEAKPLYTGYASYFTSWGGQGKGFLLKDGMLIGTISFWPNNASEIGSTYHKWTIIPHVFFDTNGPAKGPNRFGYDMFYYLNMSCHFTSCNPLSDSLGGCYFYARKDQNPYDSSVSYWKSLYKSKSYWEKLKNK